MVPWYRKCIKKSIGFAIVNRNSYWFSLAFSDCVEFCFLSVSAGFLPKICQGYGAIFPSKMAFYKPMANLSKWANLKSNFLKFHHRNQLISGIEKARKTLIFRAFWTIFPPIRLAFLEKPSVFLGHGLRPMTPNKKAPPHASMDEAFYIWCRMAHGHREDYRLLNCGARRAALRPYSPDHDPKSPVFMRVFGLPSLSKPIGKPTKSRNFWCRLTQPECSIHNAA